MNAKRNVRNVRAIQEEVTRCLGLVETDRRDREARARAEEKRAAQLEEARRAKRRERAEKELWRIVRRNRGMGG